MPLSKSQGNMYDWVSHKLSIIQGECPHHCDYCYVKRGRAGNLPAYHGMPRLCEKDLKLNLGSGKVIFVCHMSDLFAIGIPTQAVVDTLGLCRRYPDNTYVFQTKNPEWMVRFNQDLPPKCIVGTTIETNRSKLIRAHSKAPSPQDRAICLRAFKLKGFETFLTVEPIMDFDLAELLSLIKFSKVDWVNIGADSKHALSREDQPSYEKAVLLVQALRSEDIEVREKSNLGLLKGSV